MQKQQEIFTMANEEISLVERVINGFRDIKNGKMDYSKERLEFFKADRKNSKGFQFIMHHLRYPKDYVYIYAIVGTLPSKRQDAIGEKYGLNNIQITKGNIAWSVFASAMNFLAISAGFSLFDMAYSKIKGSLPDYSFAAYGVKVHTPEILKGIFAYVPTAFNWGFRLPRVFGVYPKKSVIPIGYDKNKSKGSFGLGLEPAVTYCADLSFRKEKSLFNWITRGKYKNFRERFSEKYYKWKGKQTLFDAATTSAYFSAKSIYYELSDILNEGMETKEEWKINSKDSK